MTEAPSRILANLFGLSINNLTSAIAQTAAHKCTTAALHCASATLHDTPYTDQITDTCGLMGRYLPYRTLVRNNGLSAGARA